MYNKSLEAFLAVAEYGSMTRASEIMHLSVTGIMKQINQLEQQTGIHLFERSNRGVTLSEAGKSLYEDALYMVRYSAESISRAKRTLDNQEYLIRIGTSLMNPSNTLDSLLWAALSFDNRFRFHIVPFSDYREDYAQTVGHLGDKVDIIAGIYGFSTWVNHLHQTLWLRNEPLCAAVNRRHRLAAKDRICVTDLCGETVFVTEPGDSSVLDAVRNDLESSLSQINFVCVKSFDIMIVNQCANSESVLFTTPAWAELHPLLKPIKVDWNYTVPFGILYSHNPSKGVERFIDCVKTARDTGS